MNKHISMPWFVPWLVVAAVLLMWLYSTAQVQAVAEREHIAKELLRDSQVQACERVNTVRAKANHDGDILQQYLISAAQARQATADISTGPERAINQRVATEWNDWATEIEAVDVPECEAVIPDVASILTVLREQRGDNR